MKGSSDVGDSMLNKVAFLWDESFLWGLMSYKALRGNGLPFDLIRSEDVRRGRLRDYSMLFVPGGWASNKLKALKDAGVSEIKRFVAAGGNYLGFCGGAGLATEHEIGLLNVKRVPGKDRVPSFSGRIHVNLKHHPIWQNLPHGTNSDADYPSSSVFHVWWPSQFLVERKNLRDLATFGEALPDSFSADLKVGDVKRNGSWSELEGTYGINLDPSRLRNRPAVIEGMLGKGRVILSLIHFDTPDDTNGSIVLKNLWKYLAGEKTEENQKSINQKIAHSNDHSENDSIINVVHELEATALDLIDFGLRNFLWFWRNQMFLQWKRGIRGLECCTLYIMVKEMAQLTKQVCLKGTGNDAGFLELGKTIDTVRRLLVPFVNDAERLLFRERLLIQNGHISYDKCDDSEVEKTRERLFSNAKRHGGLFKKLVDEIDKVLFVLLLETRSACVNTGLVQKNRASIKGL